MSRVIRGDRDGVPPEATPATDMPVADVPTADAPAPVPAVAQAPVHDLSVPDAPVPDAPEQHMPGGEAGAEVPVPDGPEREAPEQHVPGGEAGAEVPTAEVGAEELLLPARARRPETLIRFVLGLVLTALTLLLADSAQNTTGGLEADAAHGAGRAPHLLLGLAGSFSTTAVLLVPVAFGLQKLYLRERRRAVDGLIAAALVFGITLALNLWLVDLVPHAIAVALTPPVHSPSGMDGPLLTLAAPALAFMTAAGVAHRPRWRAALVVVLALNVLTVLVSGYANALSVLLTLLLGWTVAHGTAYALGSPNVRPSVERLFESLRQVGFAPTAAFRSLDRPPQEPRHYLVHQDDERFPVLDVTVLDRELSATGFLHRLWRRMRLRTAPERRSLLSPSGALKQEALLSYAADAAGVRTKRLLATAGLGPDAALAVYEQLPGRTLDQLDDDELTDQLLLGIWQQVQLLHARRIAHRTLVPGSILVDEQKTPYLVSLQDGDIAAGDLALRMDLAQLLTTLALRVGPERAVAAAFQVLGPDRVGSAVPLLQPLALPRGTRTALKHQEGPDLLTRIRDDILRTLPEAPVEAVRLERLRPRTLIAAFGLAAAGYLLVLQLSSKNSNPLDALTQAQPWWIAAAVALSAAGLWAATMSFVGFVPERLNLRQATLVQVAGTFLNIVTPSGVGGMAISTRFLHRSGIPTRMAVSSVGVAQAIGLVLHIALIFAFGFLASGNYGSTLWNSADLLVALLVAAVLGLFVAAIPPLRRWIAARLQPMVSGIMPRMLDLLQQPGKLAVGIIGQLMVSIVSATCLYTCALAFGHHWNFAAVAVANLIGGTLGAAVPTPGGIGGVEVVLAGALVQTTGVPYGVALLPVLLYRLVTLWLPVLPGWLSYVWLQRRQAV
ncbi:flippase-like domain-containing protein [Streptacidiphilus sp. EB129]|uniref:flippase-like domain-containing protein n=1 Tax=Streptacidiphilus sp. EB129 TaxID=3156262 RepID=UPI003512DAD1